MLRVTVKPELVRWARERSGRSVEDFSGRFKKLALWERGEAMPTLNQLEDYAQATHVPIGFMFLSKPPEERVPIPDLRTIGSHEIGGPSPDLLETIYICQQRQAWYREYARLSGFQRLDFVGSVDINASVEQTAERMREALGFDLEARRQYPTWTEALRRFIEKADHLGVLVMVNGVVGGNNRRKLNPGEFRGFALSDDLAPLVFINGADTKAAQMFTLAHELAHIWLGESALSDVSPASRPSQQIETWCNRVAAEFLVPLGIIAKELPPGDPLSEVSRLAHRFKVSTLVILRRILDSGGIHLETFQQAYQVEVARLRRLSKGSGGDYYLTQSVRAGRRFARALVTSTFEGQTSFTEAFRLLGIKKIDTFHRFGVELGVRI